MNLSSMLRLILFLLFYLQSNIGFTTPFVSSYLVNGEADRWYATRPIGDIFAYGQATLTTAEGYASDEDNLLKTSAPFFLKYATDYRTKREYASIEGYFWN